MSEQKHTEGPWDYFPAMNYEGFAIAPRGTLPTLCAVERGAVLGDGSRSLVINITCFNFPGSTEANARLIAAAPELLECVEEFLKQGDFASPHWLGDKARAVLAKITVR